MNATLYELLFWSPFMAVAVLGSGLLILLSGSKIEWKHFGLLGYGMKKTIGWFVK